jgi:CubicO group peptidase (beta-lactamase class C family)
MYQRSGLLQRVGLALIGVALASCTPAAESGTGLDASLAIVEPQTLGFSPERLDRLTETMQDLIDSGRLSGSVTMMARHGRIAHMESLGSRNVANGVPMAPDTIFRIYSMTKPITGVAMMILYEQGKWGLNDPVSRHIPEFGNLQVGIEDADGSLTRVEPRHAMTMRELMSHTGGLSYGNGQGAVDRLYQSVNPLDPGSTLEAMIQKLSGLPLRQHPGSLWHYSVSVDVQGYLVEKLSGQSLSEFFAGQIFEPLGMDDTAFYAPPEKASRVAAYYGYGANGELVPAQDSRGRDFFSAPTLPSGGGGLLSTAEDYMRFAQMLGNGGELDGARILAPVTVDLMRSNHLPDAIGERAPGTGFGLDFSIVLDPARAGTTAGQGTYSWSGAAGTWFWIDPTYDIVFVGMIQQTGSGRPNLNALSTVLTYQALVDPDM